MIATLQEANSSEIATNRGGFTSESVAHRRRLALATAADRAAELLERYPDLHLLPGCDWERLGVTTVFCLLYGAASRHFANLQLAALMGILSTTGVTRAYKIDAEHCVRTVLNLMRTLTNQIAKYAAAVNFHTPAYIERLSQADKARIGHLQLPPLPHHFRERFVPVAEHRAAQRRRRKAKTDVLSECATAILALMLARYPSAERFIRWYRRQIERIDSGELSVPAHLVYEDEQLDLPHEPGPDALSIHEVRWRKLPVRLDLTIWRPFEFSYQRYIDWMNQTRKGSKSYEVAWFARYYLQRRAKEPTPIYADQRAYFVEARLGNDMPWFMPPLARWFRALGSGRNGKTAMDGRSGMCHAGVGTPEEWLVRYFGDHLRSDRIHGRCSSEGRIWFEPEAVYRGILFGSAFVMLMLTADARSHEVLQISADRFVRPVRIHVVKNADGTLLTWP